jgi:hypothetical protein
LQQEEGREKQQKVIQWLGEEILNQTVVPLQGVREKVLLSSIYLQEREKVVAANSQKNELRSQPSI